MIKIIQNSAISINHVAKNIYTPTEGISVLKSITIDINQEDFLIIFGPSGCGKTTLLNLISGLDKPTEGTIKTYGINIWDMNDDDRAITRKRVMGIMYQNQNWIRSLTVEENVAFSLELQGLGKYEALKLAREKLEEVGIGHRATYRPTELSSGEQQKVSLARALVVNPKIIIADEPTGNLDIRSGYELMDTLKIVNESGKAVIMVTHNAEYLKYASRVIFMLDGKIYKDEHIKSAKQIEKVREDFVDIINENLLEPSQQIIPTLTKKQFDELENSNNNPKITFKSIRYSILNVFHLVLSFWIHLGGLLIFYILMLFGKWSRNWSNRAQSFRTALTDLSLKIDARDHKVSKSISKLDLADLSYRNLMVKKSRTLITIFGMGIGIGFIVFLTSIGYGLEKLVVSAIDKAENQKHIDIMPSQSSKLVIDDKTILEIENLPHVQEVQPILSLVAKVDYNGSELDSIAYGVSRSYITASDFTFISGKVPMDFDKKMEILVSKDFLATLGLSEKEAIGKDVKLAFVGTGDDGEKDDSIELKYSKFTIKAVVAESDISVLYIPIGYLKELGAKTYSQARVIITDGSYTQQVRHSLSIGGYSSVSITDTITEIQRLFTSLRYALLFVGFIALTIAILGMINTLTVSLLERTREVGLMKILGMNTDEIKALFITESMLMSVLGSAVGLILGLLVGQGISFTLTVISVSRGGLPISVASYPLALVLGVFIIGTAVGYITGLYPARRAVNMSPLDALRYE